MKQRVLGLDLGISSVGWAVIDDDNTNRIELIDWGSRIFEPGVDATEDEIRAGKGESRCSVRRQKRSLRRMYQRRRRHKEEVTAILMREGMLPEKLTPEFFVKVDRDFLLTLPENERKRAAHVVPYLLRSLALDRPLDRYQLGRALYQLAQRRGYKSNRKQEAKDSESGKVLSGIADLKQAMADSGARTLGEYFSMLDPEESRIRTRYTERGMFEDEFHKICVAQRHIISVEVEAELHHAIFFQRKLRSCKHLIGNCRLEPDKKRCSYSTMAAQRFRLVQGVNNLKVSNKSGVIRELTEDERENALVVLDGLSGHLNSKGRIALSKLGKLVGLDKGEKFTLGDDDKDICGNELNAILFRAFGDKAVELSEAERNIFLNTLNSVENSAVMRKILMEKWHFSEETAEELSHIVLPDDYCNYSRKAIENLLPDMEAGIALNTIIKLKYPEQYQSSDVVEPDLPRLEEVDLDIRNPIVQRTLSELRRVVNAVIRKYGKPDLIRVELARDLKNSSKDRENISRKNSEREKERKKIAEKIAREAGIENPSPRDILKVMLAEECDYTCPYTGKSFSLNQLLHGGEIHIEHIVPYSRSMDDSYANKTLSYRDANMAKSDKLPFEAFDSAKYAEIIERVRHFKGSFAKIKLEKFELETAEVQDFINRNLNDTRYASKLATEYLALLYGGRNDRNGVQRIQCSAGGCTVVVRRAWGGNYLLGEGEKVRGDHRHHAIDALTIAVTSPAIVKLIAGLKGEDRRRAIEEKRPLVVTDLYTQAKAKLDSAGISHHTVNKLRGALHKETIYSKSYGGDVRHARKALEDLEADKVKDIVDDAIRKAVEEKLDDLGIADPKKAFKGGTNLPVLRDRNGNIVNIIKRVRVLQTQSTRTIGSGDGQREVANGANHVLAIYSVLDKDGNEIGWDGEIVSLMDARLRMLKGEAVYPLEKNGNPLKFTLRKGDIVRWTKDGEELLCVIRGVALPQFQCVPVYEARDVKALKSAKKWFTPTLSAAFKGKMEKYTTTALGELRRAND